MIRLARAALVGASVATLALCAPGTDPVAGTPTMGALPQCTGYESALLTTSASHGNTLRLACLPGEPV
jgi:hypothetical protein